MAAAFGGNIDSALMGGGGGGRSRSQSQQQSQSQRQQRGGWAGEPQEWAGRPPQQSQQQSQQTLPGVYKQQQLQPQFQHSHFMQPPPPPSQQRRVFIEFLLSRPTIDLPPIELMQQQQALTHALDDQVLALARCRSIDGVVRITVENMPLRAEKLILRFKGGRSGAHETLLKLLLWQPASKDEFNMGLQVGRHDFPFALDIPSNLHTSSENVRVPVIAPGPCGAVTDHLRSYEIMATLHSIVQNVFVEDSASRGLQVRRCHPLHWFRSPFGEGVPTQRCIGTTAPNGELQFKAVVPKLWSIKDRKEVQIELQLDDGSDIAGRISAVECVLLQRLRHRDAPINGSQPATSSIPNTVTGSVGTPVKVKPPILPPNVSTMFLTINVPMSASQPDAEMDPFLLEHVFQITVHIMRPVIMTVKKTTFYLPLRIANPADDDDRLLSAVPAPPSWYMRPAEAVPARRSSFVQQSSISNSSGKSSRTNKTGGGDSSIKDLEALMSFGAVTSAAGASNPSSRRAGSTSSGGNKSADVNRSNTYNSGRRKSNSSSGSGDTGGVLYSINDALMGGGQPSPGMQRSMTQESRRTPPRSAAYSTYSGTESVNGGPSPYQYPPPHGFRSGENRPSSPVSPGAWSGYYANPTSAMGNGMYNPIPPPQQPPPQPHWNQNGNSGFAPSLASGHSPVSPYTPDVSYAPSAGYIPQQQQQQQPMSAGLINPSLGGTGGASAIVTSRVPVSVVEQVPLPVSVNNNLPQQLQPQQQIVGGPAGVNGSHVFRAQYAFNPTLEDEVRLEVGDLVEVLEVFDDGWARGRSLRTDNTGYFPVRCLTLAASGPPGGEAASNGGSAVGTPAPGTPLQSTSAAAPEADDAAASRPMVDLAPLGDALPRY